MVQKVIKEELANPQRKESLRPLQLTPKEQYRFNALPPISKDQQILIDQLAGLMVEQYIDEIK